MKGTIVHYHKDRKMVDVRIDRCPRKMGYWLGDVIRYDLVEVKVISEAIFKQLSFVDIGEKVRILKVLLRGMSGLYQGRIRLFLHLK